MEKKLWELALMAVMIEGWDRGDFYRDEIDFVREWFWSLRGRPTPE